MIGILIAVVFFLLLGKAICETIWGTLCLIRGLILHSIAYTLEGIAWVMETTAKLGKLSGK